MFAILNFLLGTLFVVRATLEDLNWTYVRFSSFNGLILFFTYIIEKLLYNIPLLDAFALSLLLSIFLLSFKENESNEIKMNLLFLAFNIIFTTLIILKTHSIIFFPLLTLLTLAFLDTLLYLWKGKSLVFSFFYSIGIGYNDVFLIYFLFLSLLLAIKNPMAIFFNIFVLPMLLNLVTLKTLIETEDVHESRREAIKSLTKTLLFIPLLVLLYFFVPLLLPIASLIYLFTLWEILKKIKCVEVVKKIKDYKPRDNFSFIKDVEVESNDRIEVLKVKESEKLIRLKFCSSVPFFPIVVPMLYFYFLFLL